MKALLPDARFRSPTAIDGKSAIRDEHVYSAVLAGNAATGSQTAFSQPKGATIPRFQGQTANATPIPSHDRYTDLTTNVGKAGELGNALGDAALRSIGICIESASYTAAGALNTFGAGQLEVNELLSKTSFEVKIGGKRQIIGPMLTFPAVGGAFGSMSTTENTVTVSQLTNGWPGASRRLKIPIPVARIDQLEGVFNITGTLAFSVAADPGQPCLVWVICHATVKGDAR